MVYLLLDFHSELQETHIISSTNLAHRLLPLVKAVVDICKGSLIRRLQATVGWLKPEIFNNFGCHIFVTLS